MRVYILPLRGYSMNKRLILIQSFLLSPLLHGSEQAISEMLTDEKLLKNRQEDEEYLKLVTQANELNARAIHYSF